MRFFESGLECKLCLTHSLAEEVGESVNFDDAPLRVRRPLHASAHRVADALGDLFYEKQTTDRGKKKHNIQ